MPDAFDQIQTTPSSGAMPPLGSDAFDKLAPPTSKGAAIVKALPDVAKAGGAAVGEVVHNLSPATLLEGIKGLVAHPIDSTTSQADRDKASGDNEKAVKALNEGRYTDYLGHTADYFSHIAGGYVPVLGPIVSKFNDAVSSGDVEQAGKSLGDLVSLKAVPAAYSAAGRVLASGGDLTRAVPDSVKDVAAKVAASPTVQKVLPRAAYVSGYAIAHELPVEGIARYAIGHTIGTVAKDWVKAGLQKIADRTPSGPEAPNSPVPTGAPYAPQTPPIYQEPQPFSPKATGAQPQESATTTGQPYQPQTPPVYATPEPFEPKKSGLAQASENLAAKDHPSSDPSLLDGIAQGMAGKPFAKLQPREQAMVQELAKRVAEPEAAKPTETKPAYTPQTPPVYAEPTPLRTAAEPTAPQEAPTPAQTIEHLKAAPVSETPKAEASTETSAVVPSSVSGEVAGKPTPNYMAVSPSGKVLGSADRSWNTLASEIEKQHPDQDYAIYHRNGQLVTSRGNLDANGAAPFPAHLKDWAKTSTFEPTPPMPTSQGETGSNGVKQGQTPAEIIASKKSDLQEHYQPTNRATNNRIVPTPVELGYRGVYSAEGPQGESWVRHMASQNEKAFNAADYAFQNGARDPRIFDNFTPKSAEDFRQEMLLHAKEIGNAHPRFTVEGTDSAGNAIVKGGYATPLQGMSADLAKAHLQRMVDNDAAGKPPVAEGPAKSETDLTEPLQRSIQDLQQKKQPTPIDSKANPVQQQQANAGGLIRSSKSLEELRSIGDENNKAGLPYSNISGVPKLAQGGNAVNVRINYPDPKLGEITETVPVAPSGEATLREEKLAEYKDLDAKLEELGFPKRYQDKIAKLEAMPETPPNKVKAEFGHYLDNAVRNGNEDLASSASSDPRMKAYYGDSAAKRFAAAIDHGTDQKTLELYPWLKDDPQWIAKVQDAVTRAKNTVDLAKDEAPDYGTGRKWASNREIVQAAIAKGGEFLKGDPIKIPDDPQAYFKVRPSQVNDAGLNDQGKPFSEAATPKDTLAIKKYVSALKKGESVDPILVRREADGSLTVEDGHHRLEAARQAGNVPIRAQLLRAHEEGVPAETIKQPVQQSASDSKPFPKNSQVTWTGKNGQINTGKFIDMESPTDATIEFNGGRYPVSVDRLRAVAPTAAEGRILSTIRRLESTPDVPVSTLRLRQELKDLSKEEFDRAALNLVKQRQLRPFIHADPANAHPDEQHLLVLDPDSHVHGRPEGDTYNGFALRGDRPSR